MRPDFFNRSTRLRFAKLQILFFFRGMNRIELGMFMVRLEPFPELER